MLDSFNTDYFNDAILANQLAATAFPANFPPNGPSNPSGYASLYVGLSTTIPDREGNNITEPAAGTGYARMPLVTLAGAHNQFVKKLPGIYANNVGILFPTATASWGASPIQCVLIFDVATLGSGNLLAAAPWLIRPRVIGANAAPVFIPPEHLRLGIRPFWDRRGMISETFADAIGNACYAGGALASGQTYIALCGGRPLPSDGDISSTREIQNPTSNTVGYTRALTNANWQKIGPGDWWNSAAFSFPTATGVWGTPPYWALVNGQGTSVGNVGNLILAGHINPPPYIDQNTPMPSLLTNTVRVCLGR